MNNQKNLFNLSHEFIRKTKPRLQPKHKNYDFYDFKGLHKQNIDAMQKGENHFKQYRSLKKDSEIVVDLKNQLFQLKQSMAKILHSKIQKVPSQNNGSQLKMLENRSSGNNDKWNQFMVNSLKNEANKTDDEDPSFEKEIKKGKQNEKLKFSKVNKVDKRSPISSAKKKENQGNGKVIKSEQSTKDQKAEKKKSLDESTLEEDIITISQHHKRNFEEKINALVLNQDNICNNGDMERLISTCEKFEGSSAKSSDGQDTINPWMESRGSTQIVQSLKEQFSQQNEVESLKILLKEKTQTLEQYIKNLQDSKAQISQLRAVKNSQLLEITELRNKLFQTIQNRDNLESESKKLKQISIKLKQDNNQLRQKLQIVSNNLKNKELEIINLQNIIQNHNLQIETIKNQNLNVIQSLKNEIISNQKSYQEEISKANQAISQLKNKQSQKAISITKTKQDPALTFCSPNSPKGSFMVTNRQKQLLNIIRMHQRSLQNYQKDLIFLQNECQNMHHFKMISKRLQTLIKQTNQELMNEQLARLNAKYEKKQMSFSSNPKQYIRKSNQVKK